MRQSARTSHAHLYQPLSETLKSRPRSDVGRGGRTARLEPVQQQHLDEVAGG